MGADAIGDPAVGDRPVTARSRQRAEQMVVLREQGVSLDAIAGRFEVSRERVRQILRAHGGPSPQDIADARRERAEQLAQAHVDELLARWRAGEQPDRAAAKLGLQTAACRSTIERFATDADRAARTASMTGAHGARTYSDRDIILALRGATARLGRVPIAKEYDAVARDRQLPSLPTVLNRMGGWSNALAAAELRPRAAPGRRRRWTQEACWQALRRAVDELDQIPTIRAYERIAANRDDLPSSATIRNRLGRWSSLTTTLAAQRELAQQTQVRARTAHNALART